MICNLLNISEIFYYIVGGFGLFLAGFAGFKVLLNWISDSREKNKFIKITSELKEKYSIQDEGKTYKLARTNTSTAVFILDLNTKNRFWIDSPQRLYDLGYKFDLIKEITQEEMNQYMEVRIFY